MPSIPAEAMSLWASIWRPASPERMAENSLIAAFGAVLGYIGAEAATNVIFERLLWPQRFYSNFGRESLPFLALCLPMGGPLHKAALNTLDIMFLHGLFNGAGQGHMLSTSFFRRLDWRYTMHAGVGEGAELSHNDELRNCLWARVLAAMPFPAPSVRPPPQNAEVVQADSAERGAAAPAPTPVTTATPASPSPPKPPPLRAQTFVGHLTLSRPSLEDHRSKALPFVGESCGRPGPRVLLAICTAESSAVVAAVAVAACYHTAWAVLWLAPLALRLLSAVFALDREPLAPSTRRRPHAPDEAEYEPALDFEISCPQSVGGFMVLTGPPSLVLQFMRHYGHPVRNRSLEVIQLIIIVTFAALFPIGLFCSAMWMEPDVQYAWCGYQLYVAVFMHVARYSSVGHTSTTEAGLAMCLRRSGSVLFGSARDDPGLVKASVNVGYYSRYGEGKKEMEKLLNRYGTKISQKG
ncbi:hypothetical protein RB601_009774 [Gaeumannomyces tritici]